MNSSLRTAAVPEWRRRALVQTRWQTALQAVRLPRRREGWRLVTPNATSCVALVHPTMSIFPTMPRGDRVAVVNYSRGQRAGIYTFTAGRLTSIERAPEAARRQRAQSRRRSRPRSSRASSGFIAFSSEVGTGSRQENASKQEARVGSDSIRTDSSSPLRQIPNWPPANFPPPAAARFRRRRALC